MKYFSCNGCGGCCHGPIALTLLESLDTSISDLPLVITFTVTDVRNVPIEKEYGAYQKSTRDFTKSHIGFYDKTDSGRKIVVHPQILTLVPIDSKCEHLDLENRCTIYENRPSVCRLYPFRVDTPIAWMSVGLDRERNTAFEKSAHIPCEGWDSDQIIFKSGMPTDDSVINVFKKRMPEAKQTRDVLKLLFNKIKLLENIPEKIDLYSQLNENTGRVIQVGFYELVEMLFEKGSISFDEMHTYFSMQLNILTKCRDRVANKSNDDPFISIYNNYIEGINKIIIKKEMIK